MIEYPVNYWIISICSLTQHIQGEFVLIFNLTVVVRQCQRSDLIVTSLVNIQTKIKMTHQPSNILFIICYMLSNETPVFGD